MDLVQFLILALAAWRIAYAISDDSQSGPFLILDRIRYKIGTRYDDSFPPRRSVLAKPAWKRELASANECMYCISIWYGIAATLLWVVVPADYRDILFYLALPFAISAGIILAHKWGGK